MSTQPDTIRFDTLKSLHNSICYMTHPFCIYIENLHINKRKSITSAYHFSIYFL
ncbi:hypothetical protein HanIR_Chr09g0448571 [Helianthus annuus]|nr:hypothetical protein HanIR_Chr09g0448571 [Helianthus annuus]